MRQARPSRQVRLEIIAKWLVIAVLVICIGIALTSEDPYLISRSLQ